MKMRLAILAIGVIAFGGAAGVAAMRGESSPPPFSVLSNHGTIISSAAVPRNELATLDNAGLGSDIRLLGERDGVRFYAAKTADSERDCFITGVALSVQHHFGILGCPSNFPSREQPVLDYSTFGQGINDRFPGVGRLAGFAADGVAAVGVRDDRGVVHWAEISENIYAINRAVTRDATALLARDESGEIVWSRALGGETLTEKYGS